MIVAAAVRHHDGRVFALPAPARHGDVLNWMKARDALPADYSRSTLCGFIDSERGFVTRGEAFEIAESAGQLLPIADRGDRRIRYDARDLYSEDVWDDRSRRALSDNGGRS